MNFQRYEILEYASLHCKVYVIVKHRTRDANKKKLNILLLMWFRISQLISVDKNFEVKIFHGKDSMTTCILFFFC